MKMNEILFIKHSELSERKVLYKYSVAIVIQLHLHCTFSVYFSKPGKGGKVRMYGLPHMTCTCSRLL